ncbi:nuclear transport factor 2 family protein [Mycobacterium sp.]|uniref:nuclear transport factor 2 family protein n=1 Tax=Mycobacterium sp. TaxID=1785 RepID=UPI002609DA18|nr:nuclear transport factor 2 family protein [Mycobacterium sp.]
MVTTTDVVQRNKATAEEFIDAYNSLGWSGEDEAMRRFLSVLTKDAEIDFPAAGIKQTPHMEVSASTGVALFSQRHMDVRRLIASEEAVVYEMEWTAVSGGGPGLAPAGEQIRMHNCVVLSFRDGLISRYVEYVGAHEGIDFDVVARRLKGD